MKTETPRKTVAFILPSPYQRKLESIVGIGFTPTAMARHLLLRAIDGSLDLTALNDLKKEPQITISATDEFKASVDAIRGNRTVATLMEILIDAYEAEQNQGEAK